MTNVNRKLVVVLLAIFAVPGIAQADYIFDLSSPLDSGHDPCAVTLTADQGPVPVDIYLVQTGDDNLLNSGLLFTSLTITSSNPNVAAVLGSSYSSMASGFDPGLSQVTVGSDTVEMDLTAASYIVPAPGTPDRIYLGTLTYTLTGQAGATELTAADLGTYCYDPEQNVVLLPSVTGQTGSITVAVPEPTSIVLLGIGAIGLVAYAWRRRR